MGLYVKHDKQVSLDQVIGEIVNLDFLPKNCTREEAIQFLDAMLWNRYGKGFIEDPKYPVIDFNTSYKPPTKVTEWQPFNRKMI